VVTVPEAVPARPEPRDPALYPCRITHVRTDGPRRTFIYRSYLWLVDLDRLPGIPRPWRPLASFRVKDHLGRADAPSIRSNIDGYLADYGIDLAGGRVLMLADAATFGYVFNPLSVFWCFDPDGAIVAVLAEVHNTYHQRHVYLAAYSVRFPLVPARVSLLIRWQGIRLLARRVPLTPRHKENR